MTAHASCSGQNICSVFIFKRFGFLKDAFYTFLIAIRKLKRLIGHNIFDNISYAFVFVIATFTKKRGRFKINIVNTFCSVHKTLLQVKFMQQCCDIFITCFLPKWLLIQYILGFIVSNFKEKWFCNQTYFHYHFVILCMIAVFWRSKLHFIWAPSSEIIQ